MYAEREYVCGMLTKKDIINQADVVYRGYCIDYIGHKDLWRIYRPEKPLWTVAYEDTLEKAKEGIDWNEQIM